MRIVFSLCLLSLLLQLSISSPQPDLIQLSRQNTIESAQDSVWWKLKNAFASICAKISEILQSGFPASSEEGGAPAWPTGPVVENNYEAKGQMIKLDDTMQAYQTGSGSGEKVIIWSTDTTGITDEKIDSKGTKEWADFLAEEVQQHQVWHQHAPLPSRAHCAV